jgi:uncharacterized coiled-coil protein SlyX
MEGTLHNQQQQVEESEAKIAENVKTCRELRKKVIELESRVGVQRKNLAALCSKARNHYSTTEIRKDFRAGLRVCCQVSLALLYFCAV